MSRELQQSNSKNQLQPVILLLAIAVILPTVCLLWFMTQAVKNERLAIRQKLIDVYSGKAEEIFLKNSQFPTNDPNNFSASVIFDQNDKIIYPVPPSQRIIYPSGNVQKVWKAEFSDANYIEAIKEYDKISKFSSIPDETYQAKMGQIRCLNKQGKTDDAIKTYYESAYILRESTPEQIACAKLMLVNLYSRAEHEDLLKELQNQLSQTAELIIPTETKIFVLSRLIDLAKANSLTEKLSVEIESAQKIIDAGLVAVTAVDYLENNPSFKLLMENSFRRIQTLPPLYGIYSGAGDIKFIGLLTEKEMKQLWQKSVDNFTDKLVFCRIYDDTGQQIAGEPRMYLREEVILGNVFATLNLKNYFNGYKAELYLRIGVFKEAADKKKFIYLWIALIVIILMLSSTLLASKAVLRQARLNRLKNDFIATVSHELKTPLSSMRVLVDTLLEGNYESEKTAADYLWLISKENARLSRLIDNFLTFSRMERNKQAFDIVSASPVEIANIAAEAMQTKFDKANVHFDLIVSKPLPMINADKDAMVTVLVNLLDNAYKYSYDDKQIELKVFAEDNNVCFAVKDNGIGMSRRQVKRVFDRFYQADSSLSRQSEGTGLGLAIVKFIVDAHKGQINIESKPGKGSKFTVKLKI